MLYDPVQSDVDVWEGKELKNTTKVTLLSMTDSASVRKQQYKFVLC